jgi:hypothetical protein
MLSFRICDLPVGSGLGLRQRITFLSRSTLNCRFLHLDSSDDRWAMGHLSEVLLRVLVAFCQTLRIAWTETSFCVK